MTGLKRMNEGRNLMGVYVLHDKEHRRAVLYDSTSEQAIPMPGFIGSDADAEALSFLHSLGGADVRQMTPTQIDAALRMWRSSCTDEATGELNETGYKHYEAML